MFNGRQECEDARVYYEECVERGRVSDFMEEATQGIRSGQLDWNRFRIRPLFENFVPDGERVLSGWDEHRRATG